MSHKVLFVAHIAAATMKTHQPPYTSDRNHCLVFTDLTSFGECQLLLYANSILVVSLGPGINLGLVPEVRMRGPYRKKHDNTTEEPIASKLSCTFGINQVYCYMLMSESKVIIEVTPNAATRTNNITPVGKFLFTDGLQ